MKKKMVLVLAMAVAFSMTACGGDKAKDEPAAVVEEQAPAEEKEEAVEEESVEEESAAEAADGEFTEEQQALAKEFVEMAEAYDAMVERVNACPELLENQELIDTMNSLVDELAAADELFEDPASLTPEVMDGLREAINATHEFITAAEEALDEIEGGGTETAEEITVPVEIVNNTGVDIYALALSPANSDDWGENLITEVIAADESVAGELTFTADTLKWDILVQDAEENQLTFMGVDFSEASVEGAKLVMSEGEDGNYYAEIVQ